MGQLQRTGGKSRPEWSGSRSATAPATCYGVNTVGQKPSRLETLHVWAPDSLVYLFSDIHKCWPRNMCSPYVQVAYIHTHTIACVCIYICAHLCIEVFEKKFFQHL